MTAARRLFGEQGWPAIDVTRRSIEETATAIYQLYRNRMAERGPGADAATVCYAPDPRMTGGKKLVLASSSPTRARLLHDAGVPVEAVHPGMDEEAAKRALRADGIDGAALARRLAEAKARSVRRPGRLVLGADQVLLLDSRVFDKPADRGEAAAQLAALAARTHRW